LFTRSGLSMRRQWCIAKWLGILVFTVVVTVILMGMGKAIVVSMTAVGLSAVGASCSKF
jgi:hypothetical protein